VLSHSPGGSVSGVLAGASGGGSTHQQLGKARAAALVRSPHATKAGRQAAVSRSGVRNPVRADPQHLTASAKKVAAPLKIVHAGPPIRRIPKPAPSDPFSFRMGTFNILGSQHTRGSKRWGPGTTRAGFTAALIQGYGLDLIGMQEVQDDQLNVLNARLAGYTVWPSRALGNNGVRLQIAFRDSVFELVDAHSFTTVFDHQYRPIPVVLLRNRVTGGEFYYMTIHNSPLGMVAERAAAKRAEIAHINGLLATGRPVIISGDMNEKAPFFCQVGAATGMVAANGGSAAGCVLPPPPVKIDWIMGGGGVSFSGYTLGVGGLVARASDHEFPHTTVTVTP
jgi:endonuclease/exonuclease/phosphatase family metal-dependent hydrolase